MKKVGDGDALRGVLYYSQIQEHILRIPAESVSPLRGAQRELRSRLSEV